MEKRLEEMANPAQADNQSFKSMRGNGWLPVVNQPWRAVGALFGIFFIMLVLLSGIGALFIAEDGGMTTKALRIFTILQDMLVFILPAIVAAFLATRLPASLLTVNVKPRLSYIMMAILILLTSLPAMEWLIEVNSNMHLPEALGGLEETLRGMEDNASTSIGALSGTGSVGDLIVGILIIGILTGIAEELFFRGAMQNLFMSMPKVRKHFAIWAAAFIFSFMHFQFFGFVPRLLLGAYFGYLIWWTGSVWVPIIAHAFNNSLVVVLSWISMQNGAAESMESAASVNVGSDWYTIVLSVVVTALGLVVLRNNAMRHRRLRMR